MAGTALKFAHQDLKKDRELVLEAVRQDGRALEFAHEDLKKDRHVVLQAVLQNGRALEFAHEDLKKDRAVVLAAVQQNGLALEFGHEDLKKDRDFILEAVRGNRDELQFAHEDLKEADCTSTTAGMEERQERQSFERALQDFKSGLRGAEPMQLYSPAVEDDEVSHLAVKLHEEVQKVVDAVPPLNHFDIFAIKFEDLGEERNKPRQASLQEFIQNVDVFFQRLLDVSDKEDRKVIDRHIKDKNAKYQARSHMMQYCRLKKAKVHERFAHWFMPDLEPNQLLLAQAIVWSYFPAEPFRGDMVLCSEPLTPAGKLSNWYHDLRHKTWMFNWKKKEFDLWKQVDVPKEADTIKEPEGKKQKGKKQKRTAEQPESNLVSPAPHTADVSASSASTGLAQTWNQCYPWREAQHDLFDPPGANAGYPGFCPPGYPACSWPFTPSPPFQFPCHGYVYQGYSDPGLPGLPGLQPETFAKAARGPTPDVSQGAATEPEQASSVSEVGPAGKRLHVYLYVGDDDTVQNFDCDNDFDSFKDEMRVSADGFNRWSYKGSRGRKVLLTSSESWRVMQTFLENNKTNELCVYAKRDEQM